MYTCNYSECQGKVPHHSEYDWQYNTRCISLSTKKGYCTERCMKKEESKLQCFVCFKSFNSCEMLNDMTCSLVCDYKFMNECIKCRKISKKTYQTIPRGNTGFSINNDGVICEDCMCCTCCGKKSENDNSVKWITSLVTDSTRTKLLKAGYMCSQDCKNIFEKND